MRVLLYAFTSPQQVEHGEPIFVADNDLAIDQARLDHWQTDCRHDGREQLAPVIAVAGEQTDGSAVPPGHQPVAVVLDLVQPARSGRRLGGGSWLAGGNPPGG